jgi:hypothetical protein
VTSSALAEAPVPPLWVPPRFATPRNPALRTVGGGVAKVARALRTPLMPWQQYTADVLGEVDARGFLVHPFAVVSVQRQAGKTQLDLAQSVHRCLWIPGARVWHTAQTGQDAAEHWWELVEALMTSPLAELVEGKPRKSAGSQALTFVNGSKLRPHPPTRDALHGKQSDLNNVDEGWSFEEARGAELLQAIIPTQATRNRPPWAGAQTIVWSTMGDAASSWFHGLVDAATEGVSVLEDVPPPAGFIWGIPDDVDPDDIEAVARYHPAVGHTQTVDTLRRARATPKMTREDFARAYGNRRTGGRTRIIPEPAWDAARTWEDLIGRVAYGVGVYEPRDGGNVTGALVAAAWGPDGVPVVEVLEHRPGRAWLKARVEGLTDRGQGVAVDRRGPAGPVADQLELAGVELLPLSGLDKAAACQELWDRLCDTEAREHGPRFRHRAEHPAPEDPDEGLPASRLDAAVDVAARRFIGDGAWVWSAKDSQGDVAVLEAATLAVRALQHAPAELVVGRTVFG